MRIQRGTRKTSKSDGKGRSVAPIIHSLIGLLAIWYCDATTTLCSYLCPLTSLRTKTRTFSITRFLTRTWKGCIVLRFTLPFYCVTSRVLSTRCQFSPALSMQTISHQQRRPPYLSNQSAGSSLFWCCCLTVKAGFILLHQGVVGATRGGSVAPTKVLLELTCTQRYPKLRLVSLSCLNLLLHVSDARIVDNEENNLLKKGSASFFFPETEQLYIWCYFRAKPSACCDYRCLSHCAAKNVNELTLGLQLMHNMVW